MYSSRQFPICANCQMKRVRDEVKEPEYQFLNVDESLLQQSSFLRSIKEQYLYKGALSEKQIEAFKKVVSEMGGAGGSKNHGAAGKERNNKDEAGSKAAVAGKHKNGRKVFV